MRSDRSGCTTRTTAQCFRRAFTRASRQQFWTCPSICNGRRSIFPIRKHRSAPAVEKYSDTRINSVQYAEADANGFAAALELAGPIDKVALLSGAATKTTINS